MTCVTFVSSHCISLYDRDREELFTFFLEEIRSMQAIRFHMCLKMIFFYISDQSSEYLCILMFVLFRRTMNPFQDRRKLSELVMVPDENLPMQ
jgi:hypothetical protein